MHRRPRRAATTLVGLSAAAPPALAGAAHRPSAASARPETAHGTYTGVTAITDDDVWMVGVTKTSSGTTPLAEHFDGHTWHDVSPVQHPGSFAFSGVAGTGPDNIWVVGKAPAKDRSAPLLEHWGGHAWVRTTLPQLPTGFDGGQLTGIHLVGPNLVWAVGEIWSSTATHAVALRETAGHWSYTDVANPAHVRRSLAGVTGTSATNGWAVGHTIPDRVEYALIMHWGGHGWTQAKIGPTGLSSFLTSVATVAPNSTWAVGGTEPSDGAIWPLLMHFASGHWQLVTPPAFDGVSGWFTGVSGDSASDVWVVGIIFTYDSSLPNTELLHWNGHTWTVLNGPAPHRFGPEAVDVVGSNDAWTAGFNGPVNHGVPFREHWNGQVWTRA